MNNFLLLSVFCVDLMIVKAPKGIFLSFFAALIIFNCKKHVPAPEAAKGTPATGTGIANVSYAPDYNFTHLKKHVQIVTDPNQVGKIYYLYSYSGTHVSHFVQYDSTFVFRAGAFVYDHMQKDSFIVEYTGNNVTAVRSGWMWNYTFTYDSKNRMTSLGTGPGAVTYSYSDSVVTQRDGNDLRYYCFNKNGDNYRTYYTRVFPGSDTITYNCSYGSFLRPNPFENILDGETNYFSRHNVVSTASNYSINYTCQADSLNRIIATHDPYYGIDDYYYY